MLKSRRLTLKPLDETDTENIVIWRNKKEIIDNLFSIGGITKEGHLKWYEKYLNSKERLEFVIIKNEDNNKIGTIGLSNIDNINQKAEYGIILGELDEWGKGYAKEASECIIEYGFNQLDLQKIYLKVFNDNLTAINLYKKLGFLEEGILRRDVLKEGEFKDVMMMSILKGEWIHDA